MVASALLAAAAGQSLSIFDPASPQAGAIRDLAILVIAITAGIFILVEAVLLYTIIRFRRKKADAIEPPQVYGSTPIEIAWTAAPALIVFILILIVARTEWEVRADPPASRPGDNALYVTVIGHQWWWEYRYDHYNGAELGFTTANELHIPASAAGDNGMQRPIYLNLQAADVCHSFWVPRLAGKTDLIPGRANHMWFQTAEKGLFLGQCAEYCGTQHANMLIRVQVDAPGDFERWWKNEKADARSPITPSAREGMNLFLKQSCINCHQVRGTPARGTFAPDLTHLKSRQTLASGMEPNTRENLRQWIANPQKIKPGCLMPAFGLSGRDLGLIVDYLWGLE